MAKPTGAICNLDCSYCYFLSKEDLYPGSSFRMADDVMEAYISQLLDGHRDPHVTVAWQGGEPTMMGMEFFQRVVDTVEHFRRPGQVIEHTIQTNATLIDEGWAQFLAASDFLVGVSIDGPRQQHDQFRVDKGGKPTFDRVIRGLEQLKAQGVRWNVLCTVHGANEHHGREVYTFFRDELRAQHIQFIPIVERPRGGDSTSAPLVTDRSVSAEGYGRFLTEVFDEWVCRDVGTVYVQMFDSTLASFLEVPGSLCVHSKTCGTALALEHNGDLYSCDHFVDPDFKLGNIKELPLIDLVSSPRQRAFGLHKHESLPDYCRNCDVLFACQGGCPKDRIVDTPDGEPGLNYLCPSFQAYFRHVTDPMTFMASRIRAGGFADEILQR